MTFLLVLGLCFAVLFVAGLLSRRRLGVAILALAAGSVLSQLWAASLTPALAKTGFVLVEPPMESVVAVVLILLPALFVMLRLPKARGWLSGIVDSLVWALAAVLFMHAAFVDAVVLDEASAPLVEQVTPYIPTALTACLIFGIFTAILRSNKSPLDAGRGKHKK